MSKECLLLIVLVAGHRSLQPMRNPGSFLSFQRLYWFDKEPHFEGIRMLQLIVFIKSFPLSISFLDGGRLLWLCTSERITQTKMTNTLGVLFNYHSHSEGREDSVMAYHRVWLFLDLLKSFWANRTLA